MVKHHVKMGYWALCDVMHKWGYDHAAIKSMDDISRRTKNQTLKRDIQRAQDFAAQYIMDHAGTIVAGPPIEVVNWPRARIRSQMHVGARHDTGNAMNRHKWAEDWLVRRGYVVNDTPDTLVWEDFPEQIVSRGTSKLVLTLTPL